MANGKEHPQTMQTSVDLPELAAPPVKSYAGAPLPWKVDLTPYATYLFDDHYRTLAEVRGIGRGGLDREALLRLFRASPDMLELLKQLEWVTRAAFKGNVRLCYICKRQSEHAPDCRLKALLAEIEGAK